MIREVVRAGTGAFAAVLIMFLGSLVLWLGTPLLWLWIGGQIEASSSLSTALAVMAIGVVVTIISLAVLLQRLSDFYRRHRVARGMDDPGHVMLEGVLVVSAAISLVAFVVWFLLFAGASPVPIGMNF